jgi:hypothetical protein
MIWDVDKVERVAVEAVALRQAQDVAAVLDAVAVAGRVAWGDPRRLAQAAAACAPVAVTKCLTRRDSRAIRWLAPSVAPK